jgi:hypothetical protein
MHLDPGYLLQGAEDKLLLLLDRLGLEVILAGLALKTISPVHVDAAVLHLIPGAAQDLPVLPEEQVRHRERILGLVFGAVHHRSLTCGAGGWIMMMAPQSIR